ILLPPPPSTLFPYTTLFRSVPDLQFPDRSCAQAMFPRAKRRRRPRRRESTQPAPMRRARRFLLPSKLSVESSAACSRILSKLDRSEEHTSELQSRSDLVCRL